MSFDKILVTSIGFLLIGFIYWFFLMKKERAISGNGEINVLVEGGYNPSNITLKQGNQTVLNFLRKDNSSCLEEVILPDFKIRQVLPLNQKISVTIIPKQKGEFVFSCGMGMYHGKIIVK